MNTKRKRWHRVSLWLLAFVTVAPVAAMLVLSCTDFGRRQTARAIETLVSRELPGHMEIGTLTRVGAPTVVEDLRFFHPSGREVLHVRHAEIYFDPLDALRGKLTFKRALARGGRLLLSVDPDGRPSIEAALDFPSHGTDPDPNGGLHYAMRDITVDGLLLVMRFSTESYRVRDVHGLVTIRRELTEGIRVELSAVRGPVEPEIAGQRVVLRRVDGWVHGKERQVIDLHADSAVGSGRMTAHVALFDRDKTPVEVELKPLAGVQSTALALMLYAQSVFSGDLEIELLDS